MTAGAVSCTIGTITATGQVRVTVNADVAADRLAGPLSNTASATATTADPNPGQQLRHSATVTVTTSADLALTKSASPTTIVFGQPVTYTLTVRNNGPSRAVGATITDPLPCRADLRVQPGRLHRRREHRHLPGRHPGQRRVTNRGVHREHPGRRQR